MVLLCNTINSVQLGSRAWKNSHIFGSPGLSGAIKGHSDVRGASGNKLIARSGNEVPEQRAHPHNPASSLRSHGHQSRPNHMERLSRSRSRSPATTPRAAAIYAQSRSRSRSPQPRQSRNQSPSSQPRSDVAVQQMSLQHQQQVLAVVNMVVDPLLRRIDALESEVRRLSGNQGSAYSGGDIMEAMRMADQYVLDKARLDMKLKAIREGRE